MRVRSGFVVRGSCAAAWVTLGLAGCAHTPAASPQPSASPSRERSEAPSSARADRDARPEPVRSTGVPVEERDRSAFPVPDLREAYAHVAGAAPLSVTRRNFFHSTLDVPPLDTARTIPQGALQLRLQTTHARSRSERTEDGFEHDFDGTFHDWVVADVAFAPADGWEVGVGANLAGWDEHQDRFKVADDRGDPAIVDESFVRGGGATERHINLSTFRLRAKRQLADGGPDGWDLAVAPSIRAPFGRNQDITHAGTWDAGLTGLATRRIEWGTLHANLGVTWPLGADSLFRNSAGADFDPFLHGGVALVVPFDAAWAGIVHLEGNTSAFDGVSFLDEHPATLVFGVRRIADTGALELALGTGFDHDASYQFLVHVGWTVWF